MSIIKPLSNSRGIRNLVRRIRAIFSRFGISSKRFESRLNKYSTTTGNLGCVPTFPISAVTLRRHPELIKKLSRTGIEFAVHGYIHTDYKPISSEEQTRHFKKAIDIFRIHQIPFVGFRAPYLRASTGMPRVLSNLDFLYNSSHVILWDVIKETSYSRHGLNEYQRLLDFYQARSARDYLALPRFTNGLVEIPVSMPDDETMVDRLGITDEKEITKIWQSVLQRTYNGGELFTVQLHPERIPICESALVNILQQARALNPPVWIATLGELARWWKEKDSFSLEVNAEDNGRYRVKANCSEKATLLLKHCEVNGPVAEWSSGYQSISARDFVVESPSRPVIGVEPDSSSAAITFLKSEGFVVELSDQPDNYGIYLTDLANFRDADEKPLAEAIEHSNAPVLRYWRWPDHAKSALAITGDIDSITLLDFILRVFETWRQNGRADVTGVETSL
jgi:peptidoglycan/xylan/chitin deacetylase (PgdA/CDA1 family)